MNSVKITILGSGTCVPSPRRSSPSVLIDTGEHKILFDMGPGTLRRLAEAGVDIGDISHLFFSHLHPDHTGELVNFLFASKYAGNVSKREKLAITAADGFMIFYEGLKKVYGRWIDLGEGIVDIHELRRYSPDFIRFDFGHVRTSPMQHTESSIGYRLTASDNTSIVYTGDTDYCENAVQLAMDADLLICEASFPDGMKVEGHLTPSLAGRIASEAGVKNLILTHFYPQCEGVDIKSQCRNSYQGMIICAEDLMLIETGKGYLNVMI